MNSAAVANRSSVPESSLAIAVADAYTLFIQLLDRTLRLRRATTGFVSLLRDEVIAYQLVWPN